MTIFKKIFVLAGLLIIGLTVFNPFAQQVSASEYDVLVAQLRKDDWHTHFSDSAGREKLDNSIETLLELAKNGGLDWVIRIRGIILLSETSGPRKVNILIGMYQDAFFNDECPAIKTSVITALGSFEKEPRIIDTLIDGMNDRELQVREAAIVALGKMGDEKAVPFLIKKLSDPSFAIRLSAVRSLGQIKDQRAVPFLKKISASDQDDLIRSEAISAIENMQS